MLPVHKFVMVTLALSVILSVFYFSLPWAAGTAEAEARQREELSDELSGQIRSVAVFGLAPIFTGGASIYTVAKVKKASVRKPLPLLVGFAVAVGTLGLVMLL